ncbi:hypothetical protein ACFWIA_30350 [Streptomyces sp. NPDC127068]|uniref:hypothetical protein n=1 Tax=Streptomyces sp. NPDC127068 TaxID=3347127 RepID=UPI0036594AD4
MRTWYVCLGCTARYLPPESAPAPSSAAQPGPPQPSRPRRARTGGSSDPVACPEPGCREKAARIVDSIGVPAETVARWARKAAGLDGDRRTPRGHRPARGRRSVAGPGAARSKLL